ncbi:MAG: RNB domain-containing ribonuclease [Alphaproteobacteria bacterium]|nr:RNB domain-containing ribonuclease [Alphaproteobacteria bacterium]
MARKAKTPALTREAVLEALAANPSGTKRDLARTLHVSGNERIMLKRILKELESEGAIARGRKRSYERPGALPEVTVLEITGQDPDGELLARPQRWEHDEAPPQIIIVPGREDETRGPALGIGERVLVRLTQTREGYEAGIIKRLGASVHKVLGVFHQSDRGGRVAPIDRKSKYEFVVEQRDRAGAQPNELVLCEPLSGRATGLPRARVIERLGSMNEPKAVSLIAIHAHGIPMDFPREVIEEAERAKPVDARGRTDLRKIPLVTIDPEDARDHDDAVWAGPDDDPKNKGGQVVIVAIADVAHYVTPGSALDREAFKRGNSAYFPDRVVPMLPEKLSADLCSLMENVDRPCLAVRMVFDRDGNKERHEFIRGIMRSAASLTYQQAQKIFDTVSPPLEKGGSTRGSASGGDYDQHRGKIPPRIASRSDPPFSKEGSLKSVLAPLWNAYQVLAKARDRRDPLSLDLPERRIVIGEDGKVKSIAFRERLESMRLIEEMMIMANVAAAETLEKARQPLIYRIHEQPSKEKLYAFSDYLRTIGVSFAKGQVVKPSTFNRFLAQAKGGPNEEVMNDVVLRTQAQAVYAPENIGHFGLNLQRYAHFTSPIRRYADLVVHRALVRALKLGDGALSDSQSARLGEVSDHISMTERRAMAAERDSNDRYVAAYMEDRVGATFEARITGVTRFGLFVRLPESGAEGLIPARTLGFEYFRHDERQHALIGDRSGTKYSMGDRLTVRLMEAAPLTGGLRFGLVEANAPPRHATTRPKIETRSRTKRRR